jgi:hypothetical protein
LSTLLPLDELCIAAVEPVVLAGPPAVAVVLPSPPPIAVALLDTCDAPPDPPAPDRPAARKSSTPSKLPHPPSIGNTTNTGRCEQPATPREHSACSKAAANSNRSALQAEAPIQTEAP